MLTRVYTTLEKSKHDNKNVKV
ncbi:hypothetical protein [Staphylococcus aureus]